MRRWVLAYGLTSVAGIALLYACADDADPDPSGTSSSSSSSSGTSGKLGGSTSSGAPQAQDTCTPGGGTCRCTCAVTGQTEDPSKSCEQPRQGSGDCARVCCTGPVSSASSGTSGTSGTSSGQDAANDSSSSSGVVDAADDG